MKKRDDVQRKGSEDEAGGPYRVDEKRSCERGCAGRWMGEATQQMQLGACEEGVMVGCLLSTTRSIQTRFPVQSTPNVEGFHGCYNGREWCFL